MIHLIIILGVETRFHALEQHTMVRRQGGYACLQAPGQQECGDTQSESGWLSGEGVDRRCFEGEVHRFSFGQPQPPDALPGQGADERDPCVHHNP